MKRITTVALYATLFAAMTALCAHQASAQVGVTLPDTSQSTTFTADVAEQCQITVPANITFNVVDVTSPTVASAATVTLTNIVLATNTKQVKVSLEAGAAAFTPPDVDDNTWNATDVSWNAPVWSNGTGAANTLSHSAYTEVVTSSAGATSMSTAGLVFTLAAEPSVSISGNHTLTATWKVESIGA